jgi:hypothetical protein
MPLHITNARYVKNYKIWLEFNDGTSSIADLYQASDETVRGARSDAY